MSVSGMPADFKFQSTGGEFGLTIFAPEMKAILRYCRESGRQETGGVLIGYYSQDHRMAIVTRVSGPPADSEHATGLFVRGIKGLQQLLNRLWRRREYYLGEWHYHPFSEPVPSNRDEQQMLTFAQDDALKCPEPILLVIGGGPNTEWRTKAVAYPRNRGAIEFAPIAVFQETQERKQ